MARPSLDPAWTRRGRRTARGCCSQRQLPGHDRRRQPRDDHSGGRAGPDLVAGRYAHCLRPRPPLGRPKLPDEIVVMNADGSGETQITAGGCPEIPSTFRPATRSSRSRGSPTATGSHYARGRRQLPVRERRHSARPTRSSDGQIDAASRQCHAAERQTALRRDQWARERSLHREAVRLASEVAADPGIRGRMTPGVTSACAAARCGSHAGTRARPDTRGTSDARRAASGSADGQAVPRRVRRRGRAQAGHRIVRCPRRPTGDADARRRPVMTAGAGTPGRDRAGVIATRPLARGPMRADDDTTIGSTCASARPSTR